ncbi:N-acetyltransferase [Ruminococcus sp. OM05-10BH]|nr:N-acetyltransferase [Ruminococcus sp. OM05-10BH]
MCEYHIMNLREKPQWKQKAAQWFHEKWNVPVDAYLESIEESLNSENPAPQWYLAVKEEQIIGGIGVIENDFHDRKDLTPNVCAVYVEEEFRCRGIAGKMLETVCRDMKEKGIDTLYLITDHDSFYERYGWEFYCMVQGDGEEEMTRMYVHRER